MDTVETHSNPEITAIRMALTEILEELRNSGKTATDQITAINQLTAKISGFDSKLENQTITAPPANTGPLLEILKKALTDVKLTVAAQPKNVVRKFQILLFPEQDAKLFYKVIFGRWFLWLAVMLLLTNSYKLGVHYIDSQKEIETKEIGNNKIIAAWEYLYQQKNKELHRKMDTAMAYTQKHIPQP